MLHPITECSRAPVLAQPTTRVWGCFTASPPPFPSACLQLYSTKSGRLTCQLQLDSDITCVNISPSDSFVAVGFGDGRVRVHAEGGGRAGGGERVSGVCPACARAAPEPPRSVTRATARPRPGVARAQVSVFEIREMSILSKPSCAVM